eukprot:SAG31_NODE_9518_length_1265_cov_0.927959_2_plen_151_part_00
MNVVGGRGGGRLRGAQFCRRRRWARSDGFNGTPEVWVHVFGHDSSRWCFKVEALDYGQKVQLNEPVRLGQHRNFDARWAAIGAEADLTGHTHRSKPRWAAGPAMLCRSRPRRRSHLVIWCVCHVKFTSGFWLPIPVLEVILNSNGIAYEI